jgi:dihydropyrimidine dehydrogenase (NAD+) subunit PreT
MAVNWGMGSQSVSSKDRFHEVVPALKPKEAIDEANRCLFCYDAPCIKACPTGIDIPLFIKKIATNNLYGSAKTIMEENPMGASCARVCPTEQLCEGACVLGEASQPIMIGLLQRHATDWAIQNNATLFEPGEKNGYRVAIVGSGPAGLSAARELARFGYDVTIYEAKQKGGGLSTYGIVSFRLPQEIPLWEVQQVESLGVKMMYGCKVGEDITPNQLQEEYDAVLLAVGMGSVPCLGIEGEELSGVLDALSFIEGIKDQTTSYDFEGKKVAVIGAGNTAIDAATCAKRLGADQVQILYRRSEKEMTAYPFEFEFAKQDGVEFRWKMAPRRIIGVNGKVSALEVIKMDLAEPDEKGRRRPVAKPGSETVMEVDYIIKAIGQQRHLTLIEEFGIEHQNGVVSVKEGTFQTSQPKVFAAGDLLFGGGKSEAMVVEVAEQGKRAAYAIHASLGENGNQPFIK